MRSSGWHRASYHWLRSCVRQLLPALRASVCDPRKGPRSLILGGLGFALLAGWLPSVQLQWWEAAGVTLNGPAERQTLPDEAKLVHSNEIVAPTVTLYADALPSTAPETPTEQTLDLRIGAVEALLAGRPLAYLAGSMVAAADRHGIDWRLLPVISILESSGGLSACGGNAWGYASCRVLFASFEEGIEATAAALAQYGNASSVTKLCIWVSGRVCNSRQAVEYVYRAAPLYARLGGQLALPAPFAAPAEPDEASPAPSPVDVAAPSALAAPTTTEPTRTPATSSPVASSTSTPPAAGTTPTRTPTPSITSTQTVLPSPAATPTPS